MSGPWAFAGAKKGAFASAKAHDLRKRESARLAKAQGAVRDTGQANHPPMATVLGAVAQAHGALARRPPRQREASAPTQREAAAPTQREAAVPTTQRDISEPGCSKFV